MIKDKSILAVILARGRSKGIPGKNIKPLAGKPLIAWTIEAARNSQYIDRVVVSTDSDEIAGVSETWGARAPFRRPAELATDDAPRDPAIVHAITWLAENENQKNDMIVFLQPTTPLRTHRHIDEAIEKFVADKQARSLVSVKEAVDSPYWMRVISGRGYLENFVQTEKEYVRRQDLPKVYSLNGAVYIAYTDVFLEEKSFYVRNTAYYLMDALSSIDIDEKIDFDLAELIIRQRDHQQEKG